MLGPEAAAQEPPQRRKSRKARHAPHHRPSPPGGAVDIIARAVAQQISGPLGQPVVVENRPGAGTNIAMRALIDSPGNGSTPHLAVELFARAVGVDLLHVPYKGGAHVHLP